MLERILKFSIEHRFLVVILTLLASAIGVYSLQKLPIDAVPDITNNQVQINAMAPSLSPIEVEKQVTFPIENALAGIPGLESTRSLSRNGFAQVTAIFEDRVNISGVHLHAALVDFFALSTAKVQVAAVVDKANVTC